MTDDLGIAGLEKAVGVRRGFFSALEDEDDWSFVIKLHALFEAACAHLVLFHFGEPRLTAVISRLELSNRTTGKLAFMTALELIGKRSRRYIAALSELRNELVHDVRNSEFDLEEWFSSLEPNRQRSLAVAFSPLESFVREGPHLPGRPVDKDLEEQASLQSVLGRAKNMTKAHIWLGASHVLVELVDMKGYSEYLQWAKAQALIREDDESTTGRGGCLSRFRGPKAEGDRLL